MVFGANLRRCWFAIVGSSSIVALAAMGLAGEHELPSNFSRLWSAFPPSSPLVPNPLRFIFKRERDDVDLAVLGRGGNASDCVKGVMRDSKAQP